VEAEVFATSALEEGGQHHAPAALPTKNTQYPQYSRKRRPLYTNTENLVPRGFNPRTVQPVSSRHTVHAIPATMIAPHIKLRHSGFLSTSLPIHYSLPTISLKALRCVFLIASLNDQQIVKQWLTQQTNKQTNKDKDNRFGSCVKYTSPTGAQSNISLTQQLVALKGNHHHHHLSTTITMDVSTVLMNKFIFRNSMTRWKSNAQLGTTGYMKGCGQWHCGVTCDTRKRFARTWAVRFMFSCVPITDAAVRAVPSTLRQWKDFQMHSYWFCTHHLSTSVVLECSQTESVSYGIVRYFDPWKNSPH